jgi:hypothetical protein
VASRWALVDRRTVARVRPSLRARHAQRLLTRTFLGSPERVLALEERTAPNGRVWTRVRLPRARVRATGWVPRAHLGAYWRVTTVLRIDRRRRRAVLLDRGRPVWRSPVGVGERRSPTPAGRFYVREAIRPADPAGLYGVAAFGTSAYSRELTDWPGGGQMGIHGTNQPELIPGRISHGCVRVPNGRIARLRRLMPAGTPIAIT